MIDTSLYSALQRNTTQIANINTILRKMSDTKLQTAGERADILIANTRLLRISQALQTERITKYTFVKNLIEAELGKR
jgi:hypothetical protein